MTNRRPGLPPIHTTRISKNVAPAWRAAQWRDVGKNDFAGSARMDRADVSAPRFGT